MGIRRWLRELTASQLTLDVLNAVRDAPGSTIRDLEDGVVARIVGVVEPLDDRRVRAPISDRHVLGWGFKLASLVDVQGERRELLPFAIADGGHRAVIDATHARMLIAATEFAKCRGVANAPGHLRPLLDALGASDPTDGQTGNWRGPEIPRVNALYRFSEWVIEPGMVLAVVGSGVREPDPRAMPTDYRGDRLTWIQITGTAEHPLAITDEI